MRVKKSGLSKDLKDKIFEFEQGHFYLFPDAEVLVSEDEIDNFIANFEEKLDEEYLIVSIVVKEIRKLRKDTSNVI